MELTKHQQSVLDQVKAFLKSDAPVFILRGYAGTGKTTMIKEIIGLGKDVGREVCLMAPTGRAARVLQDKTGYPASTIHRAIYGKGRLKEKNSKDISRTQITVHFGIAECNGVCLAIVDEASMLSSQTTKQEIYEFGTDNLMNDLLTFVRPQHGRKVIFVGDPAQLPPVGDNESNALIAGFFESNGLKVQETELTEVLRQKGESLILKNAMQLRNLLCEEHPNRIVFEEGKGEVENLPSERLLTAYMESVKQTGLCNNILICFSNRSACGYNADVRSALYGRPAAPLSTNDTLMVVQNNYMLDIMNGEFTRAEEITGYSEQSAPVYVQKGGKTERVVITLHFASVKLTDRYGLPQHCQLLLDLLDSDKPGLSIDEQRALYINFCIRHPDLKHDSEDFAEQLMQDEYYNCLKVKYGYAITGHKCQGGEWKRAFVDYAGRTGLNRDSLRWAYTVTTRATDTLYVANLPHITPFSRFRIDPVQQCSKVNAECRVLAKVERSPFHAPDAPDFLHAKCQCIRHNLLWTQYQVTNVVSKPYQEIYYIQTPDAIERYDIRYKKGGIFLNAVPQSPSPHTATLLIALNNERAMSLKFSYVPTDELRTDLYNMLRSVCDDLGIRITNVVEHPEDYSVMYYFNTSDTLSYIKIYINSSQFVTYAKPMSLIGDADKELVKLTKEIQNRFKE